MTCLWLWSVLFNPWQGINGRKWAGPFVWGFHLWTFYVNTPKLAMKGFVSRWTGEMALAKVLAVRA